MSYTGYMFYMQEQLNSQDLTEKTLRNFWKVPEIWVSQFKQDSKESAVDIIELWLDSWIQVSNIRCRCKVLIIQPLEYEIKEKFVVLSTYNVLKAWYHEK